MENLPSHLAKKDDQKPLKEDLHNLMSATGIEETYFYAEYNLSWVTCALGIWMIGAVNVPFYLTSAIMSYFSGSLLKIIGHVAIMCTALAMDITIQMILLLWTPVPSGNENS